MHISALSFGKLFFNSYVTKNNLVIVDVGSYDVNGTLKSVVPAGNNYIGVDTYAGKNVDIIVEDPYVLPFKDNEVDILLSSSCFEHCEFFWILFLEIMRILKPNGLFYLNAPSNGTFHRYPVDCWRFYPDSGIALQNWANRNNYNVMLLESFIGNQENDYEGWNDFVAVFVKDKQYSHLYTNLIQDNCNNFTNGIRHDKQGFVNFIETTEDKQKYMRLKRN